jgi:hypothetical protein
MLILKAGVLYFVVVFGVGFLLGTIRTLWVTPRVGPRLAELMESPFMFVAMILAARWVILRLGMEYQIPARLGMGGSALILLLLAEFGLVSWLRGQSIRQYFATRDRIAGAVYYALLALYCVMPLFVAKK